MTVVKAADPKAPFSIATTPGCKEWRYSCPWIAPLYPWNVPCNTEYLSKEVSSTTFGVFGMTWTPVSRAIGEHSSTKPMSRFRVIISIQWFILCTPLYGFCVRKIFSFHIWGNFLSEEENWVFCHQNLEEKSNVESLALFSTVKIQFTTWTDSF